MPVSGFVRFSLTALTGLVALCVLLHGTSVHAQERGGTAQTDKVQPVNSGANPYRVIRDWAKIEGRPWGGSNGVAIDIDGKSVWATDRCSPGTSAGLPRYESESGPQIRRVRERDQKLRRRHCSSGRMASTWIEMEMCG